MKDRLEKFVENHRQEFDEKQPSEKVWRNISSNLFGVKDSFWNSAPLWRAAAIVLMGFSAYLLFSKSDVMPVNATSANQDFKDIESFYSAQILEKATLISMEDLHADNSFTQDIQKLEAMYTVLAEEMKKHPSEKVKEALVLNMLVRIDLLNQQIQKLEDSKRPKPSQAII
ncbi:MAG: hypothetical protein HOP08_02200 [Cyclobacteriaceae bacterium]|nr:hypothetical protein [Cyclobacteriaceae bacterium]